MRKEKHAASESILTARMHNALKLQIIGLCLCLTVDILAAMRKKPTARIAAFGSSAWNPNTMK
jgi:hypothetical protein